MGKVLSSRDDVVQALRLKTETVELAGGVSIRLRELPAGLTLDLAKRGQDKDADSTDIMMDWLAVAIIDENGRPFLSKQDLQELFGFNELKNLLEHAKNLTHAETVETAEKNSDASPA